MPTQSIIRKGSLSFQRFPEERVPKPLTVLNLRGPFWSEQQFQCLWGIVAPKERSRKVAYDDAPHVVHQVSEAIGVVNIPLE
jgi:hypothetical protein